ncbi:hypothetical protein F511_38672 [Dorcoceras hygrometricum]|uniref:Uncharacterized protein n=1 Tax=Dorcoceras hygrometricum TaxID=472368 RepID=A0A2Z7C0F9_9LAMI|nr:hypothetical protein F511_38672 [Dorcoceras hygrometricum]
MSSTCKLNPVLDGQLIPDLVQLDKFLRWFSPIMHPAHVKTKTAPQHLKPYYTDLLPSSHQCRSKLGTKQFSLITSIGSDIR